MTPAPPASPRQLELLSTPRWGWVTDIVARWYADPLTAEDGSSPEEITEAAHRVGRELPVALVEWFTLVGRRLRPVQDTPATPRTLRGDDDGLAVWTENQGVWSIIAGDAGDDPDCTLDEDGLAFPATPLTMTLRGMLLSDTLVGAWSGDRIGPLGRLGATVRGGYAQDADSAEVDACAATYPELPVPGNPYCGTSPRGDADTFLRGDGDSGMGLEWMTATDQAFDRFSQVLVLDPPGGEQEVVLAFEGITESEWALLTQTPETLLTQAGQVPDTDAFQAALSAQDLGHLWSAQGTEGGALFHVTTTRPDKAARALLTATPGALVAKAVVAARPARISSFRVLHPADRAGYVPPHC